jgi:hypothetical protein
MKIIKSFCEVVQGKKKEVEKIRRQEVKKIEGFDTLFAC